MARKLLLETSKRPEGNSLETFLRSLCFYFCRPTALELRFRFLRFFFACDFLEARGPTKVTSIGPLLILGPIRRNARAFRELLSESCESNAVRLGKIPGSDSLGA